MTFVVSVTLYLVYDILNTHEMIILVYDVAF